jgi:hypothetical protein
MRDGDSLGRTVAVFGEKVTRLTTTAIVMHVDGRSIPRGLVVLGLTNRRQFLRYSAARNPTDSRLPYAFAQSSASGRLNDERGPKGLTKLRQSFETL